MRLLVPISVAALAAVLVVPAPAQSATRPTAPRHPSTVVAHQQVTVTGAVPPKGRPVVLQQRVTKHRWRTLDRARTRPGGRYTLQTGRGLAACRYVPLRVLAPAYRGHRAYVRAFTQRVIAAKATILVPAVVRPDEPFTVEGVVVPAGVRPVDLQRREGSGWVTIATAPASRIGQVTFTSVTVPGTTADLRLSAPAAHGLPLTRSRPAPVVARAATPAPTTTFERVSQGGPGVSSSSPVISADGRYVAYQSGVAIYLRDRSSGTTTEVTRAPADQHVILDAISPDGRSVAFSSNAPDLVSKDANRMVPDVFVYDRDTAALRLESRASNGAQSNDFSGSARFVGPTGRYLVFRSDATNLTREHRGGLFLRDRTKGTTTLLRAGHRVPGTAGLAPMVGGPASGDACDTNNGDDAQVTSFPGVAVDRVSPDGAGFRDDDTGESFLGARSVSMSSNARYFAYVFGGSYTGDGDRDVLVTDRQTGVTRRLPVDADGDTQVAISADGRYVAITGALDALGNRLDALQVSDWQGGQLWTVTPPVPAGPSFYGSRVAFSSGNEIVFASGNPALVPGDTNGVSDVFVARLG